MGGARTGRAYGGRAARSGPRTRRGSGPQRGPPGFLASGHERELLAGVAARGPRLPPRRRLLHRQQCAGRLPIPGRPVRPLRLRLSASDPPVGPGRHEASEASEHRTMGTPRPSGGRGDGRFQRGDSGCGTVGGTCRTGCLRRMRARGRRSPCAASGTAHPSEVRAARRPARRRGRLRRAGLGPHGRPGARVLGGRARGRGRLRGARRARGAPARPPAPRRHRVRTRSRRVGGPGDRRRRERLRARARSHRRRRPAVAVGGRHRRRVRPLVHGPAAHRCGTGHALLGAHPGRGGRYRASRRHGQLRSTPGHRQRPRRRRGGPGVRGRRPAPVSGRCRG